MNDDPFQPGTQVRLLSGATGTVEDNSSPMILVRTADGELVRATRSGLEVAAALLRAGGKQ